jgi:hypothetical protein
MVAPLPQERNYKREFDASRLAALRGDRFTVPSSGDAQNPQDSPSFPEDEAASPADRFYSPDSEESLVSQFPQSPPSPEEDLSLAPEDFAYRQRQAQMAAGIGAPSLLPSEVEDLPDPELSSEDEEITFGDTIRDLERQAAMAEDIEEAQVAGGALRNKMQQAMDQYAEQLAQKALEKTSRWTAKGLGNGSNAVDSVGWDGWITFAVSYVYLMARGFITVLSPEPANAADASPSQKALHTVFPPYRPLQEPGDFLYFLFLFVMTVIILMLVLTAIIMFVNIALFPVYMPGIGTF